MLGRAGGQCFENRPNPSLQSTGDHGLQLYQLLRRHSLQLVGREAVGLGRSQPDAPCEWPVLHRWSSERALAPTEAPEHILHKDLDSPGLQRLAERAPTEDLSKAYQGTRSCFHHFLSSSVFTSPRICSESRHLGWAPTTSYLVHKPSHHAVACSRFRLRQWNHHR